jgi:hypothetical protein
MPTGRAPSTASSRVVIRLILYYTVLIGGTMLFWTSIPHVANPAPASLDVLFGSGVDDIAKKGVVPQGLDEVTLAVTVGVAMLAAVALSLPVAWVYLLTRAKRGYQQSVVQLLIILPLVVAGIVLLVKYSVALAFSLAGIVAAVRFRNTLDDSKDAVYVFLATAIGLASAVNLPVAAVISIFFNTIALILWYTDFGHSLVELDGRIGEQRLRRAREVARTGTFVAHMDEQVLQNMTREQLEGLAARAWKRAAAAGGGEDDSAPAPTSETRVRVTTPDASAMRRLVEPKLGEFTKGWRSGNPTTQDDAQIVEYAVTLRKKTSPEELVALIKAAGGAIVHDVTLF